MEALTRSQSSASNIHDRDLALNPTNHQSILPLHPSPPHLMRDPQPQNPNHIIPGPPLPKPLPPIPTPPRIVHLASLNQDRTTLRRSTLQSSCRRSQIRTAD